MKNNAHLAHVGSANSQKLARFKKNAEKDFCRAALRAPCYTVAGIGVGVGVGVIFRPGDNGVGVGVAVGVGVGVGLGMILVGDFGVGVGVALGVGAKSGVGETAGVGEGEEPGETAGVGVGEGLCAKARRRGTKLPATIRSIKQTAAISAALAWRNRITQSDAGCYNAVGHLDLRRF